MQHIQPLEVEVASVQHIEGPGLREQQVQDIDVVEFSVRDVDEARDSAAQIEQGMNFDGCLGLLEARPRKQRQAQIDRGGVQRVDALMQIEPERLAGVELTSDADERLSEFGVDAPIDRKSVG